jgi:hypothetical protein
MKKISHYLKIIISILLKIITGALMGMVIGMGLGKNSILEEKKDNKNIESNK